MKKHYSKPIVEQTLLSPNSYVLMGSPGGLGINSTPLPNVDGD